MIPSARIKKPGRFELCQAFLFKPGVFKNSLETVLKTALNTVLETALMNGFVR
ncbi:hypothetical protein HMPREF0004_2246 [Achromobacter piechaudii ATCC 43553]|uniref:Uncharacterized protein n=1 Tax=Achromobacter piechaudii ATCC 43553 TaxID=742159 RepID=D4X9U9_9BURK|nr:hypothetical protein HMPREF0004_2246 [Achromobacter piechaudii ATCC 43553]